MGALTLKSFPFILRDWDIQSYDYIDLTDSFGQDTKVYVHKNKIIKIEPQFSNSNHNNWLTDKGRLFFDGLFNSFDEKNLPVADFPIKTGKQWASLFKTITTTIYLFDLCNFKTSTKYFFLLVFDNISLETLNILIMLTQINSFIKLRRSENLKVNNDHEVDLQINSKTCISKLSSSSLCLLVATNTRYESSSLNLKLRQRYLKGNFKLISIGPFKQLTFPIFFLGSNLTMLQTIAEGNNIACIDFVNASNPILITNTEALKRRDIQHIKKILKFLRHTNIITNVWNGANILSSSLNETGINNFTSFCFLTLKDLLFFSSLYIINVNIEGIKNLRKITESKLLKLKNIHEKLNKKTFINQDPHFISKKSLKFLSFQKYLYIPSNIALENNETFLSTEGLFKRTTKLIFKNKTKSNWQLIRKFARHLRINFAINNLKDRSLLFFNTKNLSNFRNFISFQFYATQTLSSLNFLLATKTKPFLINKKFNSFKQNSVKLLKTKLKYWIDDFYTGGKDRLCYNSLMMIQCSTNLKLQTTNFL